MKRNMLKIIENTKIDIRYDLTTKDIYYLVDNVADPVKRIGMAFQYGYALGQRACKKKGGA